jgi:hypothetical protein
LGEGIFWSGLEPSGHLTCNNEAGSAALNAIWATMDWNVANGVDQAPHATSSAFGISATMGVKVTWGDQLVLKVGVEIMGAPKSWPERRATARVPAPGAGCDTAHRPSSHFA